MRASRAAHPAVAQIRRAYRVWTSASLEMTERWVGHWRDERPAPRQFALTGGHHQQPGHRRHRRGGGRRSARLPRPADPALTPLPNARPIFAAVHDRDAEFELLVRALIDGLHARLRRG